MATTMTYRSVEIAQKGAHVICECRTREQYLDALKVLATIHDWKQAAIGEIRCSVSGSGSHWTAMSHAPIAPSTRGLQTHDEGSAHAARVKAIATMRAWVVRNIQDDASNAKKESIALTKAEDRALVLFQYQFNPERRLVRYRGGAWAQPGLKTEGPGELPVFGGRVGKTGIAVLRKLAAKGYLVLDEVKGEATLN